MDSNSSEPRRALTQRTQDVVQAARSRASKTLDASRSFFQSEEARFRILVVVGRFTAHTAIVLVLALAIVLAGLGLGEASRVRNATGNTQATPSVQATSRSPVIVNPGGGRLFTNFQPAGVTEGDESVIVRNVVLDSQKPVTVRSGILT